MGMYSDGQTDRDYSWEVHGERRRGVRLVPCVDCRRAVEVESDQWTLGDVKRCERCEQEYTASQSDPRR